MQFYLLFHPVTTLWMLSLHSYGRAGLMRIMSCHVIPCHVMSCHVMLCYVILFRSRIRFISTGQLAKKEGHIVRKRKECHSNGNNSGKNVSNVIGACHIL